MLKSQQSLVILSLCFFVLIEILYILNTNSILHFPKFAQTFDKKQKINNSPEVTMWEGIIKSEGSEKAYQILKSDVSSLSPQNQHSKAHYFGEALYNSAGLDGVIVCDNSFAFGCYHSFLGTAIYSEGLDIIPTLNEKCTNKLKNQFLGCQHGIGHGIISDLGYSYQALTKGLDICHSLPGGDPIGGCIGGVFMEYNFETMLANDAKIRTLESDNPLAPCNNIAEDFRVACYFWQSQWWGHVLNGSILSRYQQIGALCQSLINPEEQKQCYIGSGNIAGTFTNWQLEETSQLCQQMPDDEAQMYCKAGAAGAFLAEPTVQNQAHKFCQDSKNQVNQLCLKAANISIGNIQ